MIDAKDIIRDTTPKSVFNPLPIDFVDEIRDDDNKIQIYTVPSMEIVSFPSYLADRIINDLITAIENHRQSSYLTPEQKLKIRQEVEI